jgi:hypothetical protein
MLVQVHKPAQSRDFLGSLAGNRSHTDPNLLSDGKAKTAAFALQKIHFSNDRFWREADICPESLSELTAPPKPTVRTPMIAETRRLQPREELTAGNAARN